MPRIEREYRVLRGPAHTVLGGSSLGGLMGLYGHFRHPETFGGVLSLSPSVWIDGGVFHRHIADLPLPAVRRIYLDAGAKESRTMVHSLTLVDLLVAKGCVVGDDLMWRPDARGRHNEAAWRRRLPKALRFLYG